MNDEVWEDMNTVAALAALDCVELPDDRVTVAAALIVSYAPEHIQDNFKLCCAYHIFRDMMKRAIKEDKTEMILQAQTNLMQFLEP